MIVKSPYVNFYNFCFCNCSINVVATSLNFLLDFHGMLNRRGGERCVSRGRDQEVQECVIYFLG